MKTVFRTNAECIHAFAQRTQEYGRSSGGNVYFDGDTLYSYGRHYPIATFKENGRYVILNDVGYSVSTARHISIAHSALRQYRVFLETRVNLRLVYERFTELGEKLVRARKPELYIPNMIHAFEFIREYADFAGIKGIKTDKRYRNMRRFINSLQNDESGALADIRKKAEKRAEDQRRRDAVRLAEAREKFANHETDWFRIGDEDYLRLSLDGSHVETSQGVRIRRENAATLYRMIERGMDIRGKHIEHYVVTSINGTLKIGCHSINMDDVHRIGKQITAGE